VCRAGSDIGVRDRVELIGETKGRWRDGLKTKRVPEAMGTVNDTEMKSDVEYGPLAEVKLLPVYV